MKILHVLNHSVPHIDGYSVRSEQIVRFQAAMGLEPVVVTSPRQEPIPTGPVEEIAGVRYYRSARAPARHVPAISDAWLAWRFGRRITEVVRAEHPAVIHCHSPCRWGLAALRVARRFRLPYVYEIRGFWEDAAVDQGMMLEASLKYKISRRLETSVARRAGAVVTISEGMAGDLAQRGIDPGKTFLVPNGVDLTDYPPTAPDTQLASQLGLEGGIHIGFVGSLYVWEGVDDLIRAVPHILEAIPDAEFLVVGGGHEEKRLRELLDSCDGKDRVHLVGPVARNEVLRYYSLLDILVYPRKSSRTTELVTPLKPLEAMAMQKAVLGSDVGGIRELIAEGTGALFRAGDVKALAAQCIRLVEQPEVRERLGRQGREHVRQTRDWTQLIERYGDVYEHACRRASQRIGTQSPAEKVKSHTT